MSDWWQQTFPTGRQGLTIRDAAGESVEIAYGEVGAGQPIVLVHGIGSWSYGWRGVIPLLADRYRVICFDAKGCGFSAKPTYPEQMGHQIPELAAVLRGLCLGERAIVVAESLGALTTLGVAQTQPELLAQLVLINVPVFLEHLPSQGMRLISQLPLGLVQTVDQLRLAKLLAPLTYQIVRLERQQVLAAASMMTNEELYQMTYPYLELPGTLTRFALELQLAAQEIDRLHQGKPNVIRTLQDNLDKIHHPTLLLWGDQDRWFPVSHGEQLCDRLPNAQLQVLPTCGHAASANCPTAVSHAVLEFLATQTPGQQR